MTHWKNICFYMAGEKSVYVVLDKTLLIIGEIHLILNILDKHQMGVIGSIRGWVY